jgi:2-succinyl-6-hydroxy-2,4-cyclohexadiene-1-carboxylate synthase
MIWALHGAFGDANDWNALADEIGQHQLRAVDLWVDAFDLPLSEAVEVLNQRVSAVDSSPVMLGYSMGARLGLHALIADPRLWNGAILVAPHPGLLDADARHARRIRDQQWATRFDELCWSEFWAAWTSQAALATADPRPLPPERPARRRCLEYWSLSEQDDLRPQLGQIECPVLWVTGERDERFTDLGSACAPLIPKGKQVIVPGASHRVPWDAPHVFATLVQDFRTGLEIGRDD